MSFADVRRQHIAFNIGQNPTTISIQRMEKRRKGGGYKEVSTSLPPVTIRIYTARSQIPKTISILAGTKQTDKTYGLLADEWADIKAGPEVTDRFIANGEHFEIVAIYPQMVADTLVGYQAALERVK